MASINNHKLKHKSAEAHQLTVGNQLQAIPIATVISLIFFGGIAWRLSYLQLEQGASNQQKAYNNRIRIVPKSPVRGRIFDRKGLTLATNRQSYTAYIWPKAQKERAWSRNRRILAQILALEPEAIQAKMEEAGYSYPSLIPIARNLTPEQITALEEYKSQLQWIEIDTGQVREYPQGKLAAHVIGYTGELDSKELEQKKSVGYRLGDVIGKMGVESAYEPELRGEWGGIELGVDGAGQIVSLLGEKPAVIGADLFLTLDAQLQKATEAILGTRKGAIVALDPNDGSILAMASYPSFDPNIFSAPITPEAWQELQSQGNPFLNMALRAFPPASTFKVVTAAAGMETGKFPSNTVLGTYPYLTVGGTRFGEWNKQGFGPMGYVSAIAWSSNTFFGQVGRGVGGEELIKWSRLFGFGRPTGLKIQGEANGLIADDAWKRRNFKDWGWTVGDTVNMSIGQGFTNATPLQIAVMFSAIANNGYVVQPYLVQQDQETALAAKRNLQLQPNTLKTIQAGLRAVATRGTGTNVNSSNVPAVAGKSGTAEAPPGKPHTWFGGYAPFNQPEIVVVAFVEHSGGGGGQIAAPLVRQVMEAYFRLAAQP